MPGAMFCAKMRAAMQRYAMRAHALFFARLLRRRRAFDAEVCMRAPDDVVADGITRWRDVLTARR
jgi:hypothetical protein